MTRILSGRLIALPAPPDGGRIDSGWLYRQLRAAILAGQLAPGSRLPSTRAFAREHATSRAVAEAAYARLESEGLVRRRHGSGSHVADALPVRVRVGRRQRPPPGELIGARARAWLAEPGCVEPDRLMPFNAGQPDPQEFPWTIWERCWLAGNREARLMATHATDPRGVPELRAAIADHLIRFRGLNCGAERVVVFNSSQTALLVIALLLVAPGQCVAMEDPGYPGARAAFAIAGADVRPVAVDQSGLRVQDLDQDGNDVRLVYVTPSHQYPTGVALDEARRKALLEWGERDGRWIVEDDYDGDFRYSGASMLAMQGRTRHQRTLYVGTFSKAMFPSLRLAYAVLPEPLIAPATMLRAQIDGFSPAGNQLAMARFMADGAFDAHLRRTREAYRRRRVLLRAALQPIVSLGWALGPADAGLHQTVVEPIPGAARQAVALAPRHDLALARVGQYAHGAWNGPDALFLRYGALRDEQIVDGAARLCRMLAKRAP